MEEINNFRPMHRSKQQLSLQDCESILIKAYRGYLSLNGEEGYPYTIPINFIYIDKHIYFHSAISGHKIDAIIKNPKACFTIIDDPVKKENDWWYHVRSVICFGQIKIIDNPEEKIRKLKLFGQKYFPKGYDIDAELRQHGAHAVVLDFSIEHLSGKQVKEN